ncbi:MAG: transcription termination/antitermination protein NusG [Anaerolineales bacterium]|nr:transcription termination/antitermination protein NusG [Anaerolineales bacterium]
MDINQNEEQIEEEIEQIPQDLADLAPSDTEEPVEAEQAEQEELAAAEAEEQDAVEADEPVEDEQAEQVELDEPAAIETEEVVEAELDEPVEAEAEEPAAIETEEPVEVEADEPVEAEQTELEEVVEAEAEEPVDSEADELVDGEADEPIDGEAEEPAAAEQEEPVQDESEPAVESSVIPEPIEDDGRAWYVVHCYSGNEDKVRHNILQRIESMGMDDLIFDVVVPTEDEVNIKNGERQTVEKKVFPGYILVNLILTEESWYMVRNTPGVTGFVGMGNDPTPLQPEEVARILKRMESESPRINVTFRQGERVRIVDGPFEDFYGKVSEIDMDRATVRVMVNFFGRETPVELDFLQVEEA